MGFKKLVITEYDEDSILRRLTLTLRVARQEKSFKEAKKAVSKLVLYQVVGMENFTVTWVRDGSDEGYMVFAEKVPKK